ncbi:hypothetical protein PSTT_13221 [Puccinia striiformis]|uniref:Uncharacterized protein n=1 Tax=Puccinia striiformis TaxID=27350 RepID=A0A2S4USI0_9BASI|nr:hypothetical protein PSTT_13221 [Puccinia striiformis]
MTFTLPRHRPVSLPFRLHNHPAGKVMAEAREEEETSEQWNDLLGWLESEQTNTGEFKATIHYNPGIFSQSVLLYTQAMRCEFIDGYGQGLNSIQTLTLYLTIYSDFECCELMTSMAIKQADEGPSRFGEDWRFLSIPKPSSPGFECNATTIVNRRGIKMYSSDPTGKTNHSDQIISKGEEIRFKYGPHSDSTLLT